jgi:hypothetical protein
MCGAIRLTADSVCGHDNKFCVALNSGVFFTNSRLIIFLRKPELVDLDSYVFTLLHATYFSVIFIPLSFFIRIDFIVGSMFSSNPDNFCII